MYKKLAVIIAATNIPVSAFAHEEVDPASGGHIPHVHDTTLLVIILSFLMIAAAYGVIAMKRRAKQQYIKPRLPGANMVPGRGSSKNV